MPDHQRNEGRGALQQRLVGHFQKTLDMDDTQSSYNQSAAVQSNFTSTNLALAQIRHQKLATVWKACQAR